MAEQLIFKRHEGKYLLPLKDYEALLKLFENHMTADKHGKNTICSLYYDTPDFRLIRRSLEKPIYKEKLRLRSYGIAEPDTPVFIELKKKYDHVVYKRRIQLPERKASEYLSTGMVPIPGQVVDEINYFINFYPSIFPAMLLSYEREAYYGIHTPELRITFDTNILWRNYDLSLCKGIYGRPILSPGQVLMEIKTPEAIPLWMTDFLSQHHIYKTSFSKYGRAYMTLLEEQRQTERNTYYA